jgi:ketosteroid isomerase-like protein
MSTPGVAAKLVQYCREGKNLDAINELYSDDVVSVEPMVAHGGPVKGKQAIIEKNQHWYSTVEEVHSAKIGDPIITGDFFACTMEMDVTYKQHGRMAMYEIAVYQVKDGKIIAEQFFYAT